jgi:hypothetical protein
VARQVVDDAGGRGIEPGPVPKKNVGPTNQAVRIGIAHDWSDGRPGLPMRVDQRFGPARLRIAVIFGENHDRRACLTNARRVSPRDGPYRANFDHPNLEKLSRFRFVEAESIGGWGDDHHLEAVSDVLSPDMPERLANRVVVIRGDDHD